MPDHVPQGMAPSGCVCLALLPQGTPPPQGIHLGLLLELALMCPGQRQESIGIHFGKHGRIPLSYMAWAWQPLLTAFP